MRLGDLIDTLRGFDPEMAINATRPHSEAELRGYFDVVFAAAKGERA